MSFDRSLEATKTVAKECKVILHRSVHIYHLYIHTYEHTLPEVQKPLAFKEKCFPLKWELILKQKKLSDTHIYILQASVLLIFIINPVIKRGETTQWWLAQVGPNG